jgi:DUF4097 and DUF4098 domain-containing protein YvlB
MTTFHTHGPIAAIIELQIGDIKVDASDRDDCVVSIRPRDDLRQADVQAAAAAHVDFTGETLVIRTTTAWHRFTGANKRDGSIGVEVSLPTGSTLKATTGAGLVHAEGELADTIARTGIGDIRLDGVGALTARSGLGDISAEVVLGEAKVTTSSGALRLGVLAGSATVKNSNGTAVIDECRRYAHVRSSCGDITIGQALTSLSAVCAVGDIRIDEVSAGSVTARTGAGTVDVSVREGAAAWLEVSARHGFVRNHLAVTPGPEAADSTVEVRARTSMGDVTIRRAPVAERLSVESG